MSSSAASDPTQAFQEMIAKAKGKPLRTAVVHPVDHLSLGGAMDAKTAGLIEPVLIGPRDKIASTAKSTGIDLSRVELIDTPHSHAAAAMAAKIAGEGSVNAIMKGAIHTNELMKAIIDKSNGLRTERRMSHVFVMETPAYPKHLMITDGAINITPDLKTKRDIVQNAIELAIAIGVPTPLVAILSATEEVDPNIPSTIDAAALCKMADRKQIVGGLLDGPLAFDLAISAEAVAAKGMTSPVAGAADILVVPSLEAGNMIAKQLDYLAGAAAAGLVIGAKVPIILTSRADSAAERVGSCALANLFARAMGMTH
ncbi:bifunctional enoyl-CoA hydratase/phosphate acetyltransferase [Henriciella mobilis]|uniref:Bifunctional enoyl-CoA hydratase/phosphate acetyltransferase n=1 Tax=Henriciella mobilis TaxID=2305467 RepID=A0A399R9X1_9PROT|nr:bifunctional enoyl-CoA hydratase/phosphate acetyltransferase [Henriciella mobilis]RIJ28198.1 bifunctional enoyl-CoA hydratase/phosphate acetyltransferase [Henriciella mobilis]